MKCVIILILVMTTSLWAGELEDAKKKFEQVDKKLNVAFRKKKKTLESYEYNELKKLQREWLEYRNEIINELAYRFVDENGKSVKKTSSIRYWELMEELTKERLPFVAGWKKILANQKGYSWEGLYTDGYGGEMNIKVKDGQLHFQIGVSRAPLYRSGELEGSAEINGLAARFSDNAKNDPTWLNFYNSGGVIKLEAYNARRHGGRGVYFDGIYARVGKCKQALFR